MATSAEMQKSNAEGEGRRRDLLAELQRDAHVPPRPIEVAALRVRRLRAVANRIEVRLDASSVRGDGPRTSRIVPVLAYLSTRKAVS